MSSPLEELPEMDDPRPGPSRRPTLSAEVAPGPADLDLGPVEPRPPASYLVRVLRELAPFVVLAGLVAALLTWALTGTTTTPTAEARVGLTEEVRWPYYDTVREDVRSGLVAPELTELLSEEFGPVAVEADVPPSQAYVDLTVTASSDAAAVAAADRAAEVVSARVSDEYAAGARRSVEQLTEARDESAAELAAAEAALADARDASADAERREAAGTISDAEYRGVIDAEAAARAEVDRIVKRLAVVDDELARESVDLTAADDVARVLRPGTLRDGEGDDRTGVAVATGLIVAVAVAAAAFVSRPRWGRLVHPWLAAQAHGLADLGSFRRSGDIEIDGRGLDNLERLRRGGARTLGIVSAAPWVAEDLAAAMPFDTDEAAAAMRGGLLPRVVDLSDEAADPDGRWLGLNRVDGVVVAADGAVRSRDHRRLVAALRQRRIPVAGVVWADRTQSP